MRDKLILLSLSKLVSGASTAISLSSVRITHRPFETDRVSNLRFALDGRSRNS